MTTSSNTLLPAIALLCSTVVAQDQWVARAWLPGPNRHQMAYDRGRERMVSQGFDQVVWEWDGRHWAARSRDAAAVFAWAPVFAHDEARQCTVRYDGVLRTTSEWDGAAWTQRTTATAPPARSWHAMAYDALRGRVVLFGGLPDTSFAGSSDTWEYDGNNWFARGSGPMVGRLMHAMAYDRARGRIVVHGGVDSSKFGQRLSDAWEWNGNVWTQRANGPAMVGHGAAFDEVRQVTVCIGLVAGTTGLQTWEWNGISWTQRTGAPPVVQSVQGLGYDVVRAETLLLGNAGQTWRWNGTTWSRASDEAAPNLSTDMVAAYDAARDEVVSYGWWQPTVTMETFTWDGVRWHLRQPVTRPGNRYLCAMAHDAARQRTVLFGGYSQSPTAALAETWEWNGSDWTLLAGTGPPARLFPMLAFDAARQVCVLFGGRAGSYAPMSFGDTWEWNGVSWTQRSPQHAPSPRYQSAMAGDPTRSVVVLYGGLANGAPDDETWEWDGSDWSQRAPANTPGVRQAHAMTWDPVRQRVVLLGGIDSQAFRGDLWAWDGSVWSAVPVAGTPPVRAQHALVHHAGMRQLLALGGRVPCPTTSCGLGGTWLLGSLATVTARGNGCPGSSGVPVLSAFDDPAPGRDFGLDVTRAASGALVLRLLATGPAAVPVPGGCTMLVDSARLLPLGWGVSNAAGFLHLPLAIPRLPALRGFAVSAQAAILDPVRSLAATNALDVVVGDL